MSAVLKPRLAVLGSTPAFAQPLHVGTPNIGDQARFLARMAQVLDRRCLTNGGPLVREFEERLAELVNVKHCIAMSNATVALEIVTRSLGFTGEVITPSMTFIATAHALQWQQITPIFGDIAAGTHHLDPSQIERLATPRTAGILAVNLWGRVCDLDGIGRNAAAKGLPVVYDSSHALGCSYRGTMVGSFGHAEVFSFHATKFINSFEGGAIATNCDDVAAQVRLMKNFGFSGRDKVDHIGINGKMSEAHAAMGLTNLESFDEFIAHNRENYEAYRQGLRQVPGVRLVEYDESERCNYQYIVIEVDSGSGFTRNELLSVLQAENVDARRYFYPGCHRMEPYRSYFPNAGLLLPNTEKAVESVLALPTGTAVRSDQATRVAELIAMAVDCAPAVRMKQKAARRLKNLSRQQVL
jgi:dTDP-4-amino-4,6-dideoxygalactose transaminase